MTTPDAQTQTPAATEYSSSNIKDQVIEGPDLNSSRTPLDKKNYRQIIIKKNGLKVVLISDTLAMIHQEKFEFLHAPYSLEVLALCNDSHESLLPRYRLMCRKVFLDAAFYKFDLI